MEIFANQCPWYVAGPLLGLLVAGLLWAINKPLGALGGYVDTVQWMRERDAGPSWRVLFLAGMVIGGALSALAAGGYQPTLAYGTFTSSVGATLGIGGSWRGAWLVGWGTRCRFGARRRSRCER